MIQLEEKAHLISVCQTLKEQGNWVITLTLRLALVKV